MKIVTLLAPTDVDIESMRSAPSQLLDMARDRRRLSRA
jgi:hypothetical protein